MGDMADMLIDTFGDVDEHGLDGYDNVYYDNSTGRYRSYCQKTTKTCRCCGATGLTWGLDDGKWRLFNDKGIHKCQVNPLK